MNRGPPRSKRTETLFPNTPLFRSPVARTLHQRHADFGVGEATIVVRVGIATEPDVRPLRRALGDPAVVIGVEAEGDDVPSLRRQRDPRVELLDAGSDQLGLAILPAGRPLIFAVVAIISILVDIVPAPPVATIITEALVRTPIQRRAARD